MSVVGEPGTMGAELAPGTQVGEYVVERKIGQGGFGAVFLATHPVIGKQAAVKVLAPKYSADRDMVSRFSAEAKAVNQIRHRHIIDIFSFGFLPDGRAYYVMEYLAGESLADRLDRDGALSLEQALPILDAVARAIDAAHAKGIAHRDLKPDNIFLAQDADGAVFPKLLDFGIAKLLGEAGGGAMHKTSTGVPMGTPFYMSPEQCRGRDVDHRTDLYAFGVLTYQVLTGAVPFDGDDYMEILLKQIGEQPQPPSQRRPDLPQGIDGVIAWMMEKDPAARPRDLAAAMTRLAEVAASGGASVDAGAYRRSSVVGAARPTPRPGKLVETAPTMAAGAAVAAPATVTSVGASRRRRAPIVVGVGALVAAGAAAVVISRGGGASHPPAAVPVGARPEPALVRSPPDAARVVVAPPAVAPLDADPTARLVFITLEGVGAGAEVLGPGGAVLGIAPRVQLPAGATALTLLIREPGQATRSVEVVPDRDRSVEVPVTKARPTPKPKPKPKCPDGRCGNDLEDPFR